MSPKQERSPWVYVGCGCAVLVVLIVLVIAGAGMFVARGLKNYAQDMEDPVTRNERAREMLGAGALPHGYNAQVFFSVPFLLEFVMLTDGEPVTEENSEIFFEHANLFTFFEMRNLGDNRRQLDEYLAGERDSTDLFENMDFDIRGRELLGRGGFEIGDQQMRYVVQRGELDSRRDEVDGVFALVGTQCAGDDKLRVSMWFQRLPEPLAPNAAGDAAAEAAPGTGDAALAGTPADQEALRALLAHFDVCV